MMTDEVSDLHIQMCRAAMDDLGWEPAIGDRVYTPDRSIEYVFDVFPDGILNVQTDKLIHATDCVPLFSEGWLQKKIMEKEKWKAPSLLFWFYHWYEDEFKYETAIDFKLQTMNVLWLCFTMQVLYQKRWDTDRKIWIK